jgi:hypothetical protein
MPSSNSFSSRNQRKKAMGGGPAFPAASSRAALCGQGQPHITVMVFLVSVDAMTSFLIYSTENLEHCGFQIRATSGDMPRIGSKILKYSG